MNRNSKAALTATELGAAIKSGDISGVWVFCGDEDYLKSHYKKEMRDAVLGDEADTFNRFILTAENYSPQALKDAIETLPMFADRKIVEVSGINFNQLKDSDLETLCAVLSIAEEHADTTVVLVAASDELTYVDVTKFVPQADKKSAAALTKLYECAKVVAFPYETEAKLAKWVLRHFRASGAECSPELASKLISHAGRDMFRLAQEIKKLSFYALASGRTEITDDDIYLNVKEDFDFGPFDFSNALLDHDRERAFKLLYEMRNSKDANKLYPPELISAQISRVFADLVAVKALSDDGCTQKEIAAALKMNSYRVRLCMNAARNRSPAQLSRALALCRSCDLAMKSTALDNGVILDRLVLSLM
ncbi:MAG TPA: DNA polymerase III subunit delta [Clostridiales bacterium]|jgi:DNA polymerase-3 subunit delta|nr:DNA polymerase III subunit delta [Clostridiales bacterium]